MEENQNVTYRTQFNFIQSLMQELVMLRSNKQVNIADIWNCPQQLFHKGQTHKACDARDKHILTLKVFGHVRQHLHSLQQTQS